MWEVKAIKGKGNFMGSSYVGLGGMYLCSL